MGTPHRVEVHIHEAASLHAAIRYATGESAA